jgi:hypothetical protein
MGHVVFDDGVDARLHESFEWILEGHPVDLAGIRETADVILETKYRWTFRSRITPDSLEHARAVMHHMADDVNGRVLPLYELPIPPDSMMIISPRHRFLSCSL